MNVLKSGRFQKDLIYMLGATLMGIKPAELLNLQLSADEVNGWGDWCKEVLADIKIIDIKTNGSRRLILFYHEAALRKTLLQDAVLRFLRVLDYPPEFDLDNYILHLSKKIRTNTEFPHEAGVFLGYPLKDVLGYMGYITLPCAGVKGWRYYGCYCSSEIVYNRYSSAREDCLRMLKGRLSYSFQ